MSTFLSLDPSTTRLGWATWSGEGDFFQLAGTGWNFGSFEPRRRGVVGFLEIKEFLSRLTDVNSIDVLVYEQPAYFEGSKGVIAYKQGFTINLGIVVGIVIGVIPNLKELVGYTPQQWKGSVSKEITHARWRRAFADSAKYPNINHDAVDAIMLLYHHIYVHANMSRLEKPSSQ